MDPEAVTKIVAAILAGHAASQGGNSSIPAYVARYKSALEQLREFEAEEKQQKNDAGVARMAAMFDGDDE